MRKLCGDYRALNARTVRNRYLVRHSEFRSDTTRQKSFYHFWLVWAYHQILVAEENIPKAITTFGMYEFLYMLVCETRHRYFRDSSTKVYMISNLVMHTLMTSSCRRRLWSICGYCFLKHGVKSKVNHSHGCAMDWKREDLSTNQFLSSFAEIHMIRSANKYNFDWSNSAIMRNDSPYIIPSMVWKTTGMW